MSKNSKETIILHLISEYNKENITSNEIYFSQNDVKFIGLSEKEISKILLTLQEDGLLTVKTKSVHNDFSMPWKLALKSECIEYFEIKKNNNAINRREWIRTYIPITLSIIAIIISIISLVG